MGIELEDGIEYDISKDTYGEGHIGPQLMFELLLIYAGGVYVLPMLYKAIQYTNGINPFPETVPVTP